MPVSANYLNTVSRVDVPQDPKPADLPRVRWRVVLMTLTSLTEGLGVALLFPILQVSGLNMTNEGHVGHYTGEVQELLKHSGLRPSLWLATMLMIFMLLMALRSLFSRAQSVGTLNTV